MDVFPPPITTPLAGRIAVDARMIARSGIGVTLRRILDVWRRNPPAEGLVLYGDPQALAGYSGSEGLLEVRSWQPKLYSISAALSPPEIPADVRLWYSPHYATCLRTSCPLVCHIQDLLHITHPSGRGTPTFMKWYLGFLRQRASVILTTTRHVKVQLQTLYGFAPERTLITGLGCGAVEGVEPGSLAGLPVGEGPYLLAIGILKRHKNWPMLLDRYEALGERVPRLLAVGLAGSAEVFYRLVTKRGLEKRITVIPPVEDAQLAALYRGATALVFPSGAEGFGLPIAEALCMGTPFVCAERSPMKEIAGDAAWYFDPDVPRSFDEALLGLLSNDAERADRVRIGLERATSYRWESAAARITEGFSRALEVAKR